MSTPPRLRILLVDDDPLMISATSRLLSREHDVVAASSAAEALELVKAGEEFGVVLCDLMMPGMSGIDLYATISSIRPRLASRMAFIHGGAQSPAAQDFIDSKPNLEKPFEVAELRTLVTALVAAY